MLQVEDIEIREDFEVLDLPDVEPLEVDGLESDDHVDSG
jgi:hypothetical protein